MSEIDMTLLPDFIVEAEEHLEEMESLLLQLVAEPDNLELLNDIFRPIHTIKGGAQYIGLDKVSRLAHRLEDLLDLLREGKKESSDEIVELLIAGRDRIARLVTELQLSSREESDVEDLVSQLGIVIEGEATPPLAEPGEPTPSFAAEEATVAPTEPAPPFVAEESLASEAHDALAVPDQELYREDEDEELFSIFIHHLGENVAELVEITAGLADNPDSDMQLSRCIELVDQLRSSANYMDYADLVMRYQIWKGDIENALDQLLQGEVPSYAFMEQNIAELKQTFPQLEAIIAERAATAPPHEVEEPQLPPQEAEQGEDITDEVLKAFAMEGFTGEGFAEEEVMAAEVPAPAAAAEAAAATPEAAEAEEVQSENIDLSLLPDFVIEADEHLEEMEALLLQLSSEPDNHELLNDIFRPIHTIKGGAQYIGLERVSRLAHRLEDLLDLLREGKIASSAQMVDLIISARDRISRLVRELNEGSREESPVEDLVKQITQVIEGGAPSAVSGAEVAVTPPPAAAAAEVAAESYHEEEDAELFEIFISQLEENYKELSQLNQQILSGAESAAALTRTIELVDQLRSSANYMDYMELAHRYQIWRANAADALDSLNEGGTPALEFMAENLNELRENFPRLQAIPPAEAAAEAAQIKVVVNEPVAGGLEDTLAKKTSPQRTEAAIPARDDSALFASLSGALDQSLNIGLQSDYDTLNQIFDELVSGSESAEEKEAVTTAVAEPKEAERRVIERRAAQRRGGAEKEPRESKVKKSVRVDADKIDTLMNQVGELVVDRSYFFQLFNEMRNLQRHLKETLGLEQKEVKMLRTYTYRLSEAIAALGRTSNELQEGVMKMRMLPISQIFNRYPRLVHDLTRNSDKRVNLVVKGEDTELDRMIVEELSDPLIHIIRNSVDHGIESSEERLRSGKGEEGTLVLEAYQESNHIVIEVTDDGRGIDPEKIRRKAIEKGLLSVDEQERFGPDELIPLIMTAGFSTAEKISGTSGRGVGMDVVKKNIEKLNGTLEIDSKVGIGTQMRLKIPLTLAIIHALMVRVQDDLFTIPLANVDETVRIYENETSIVEGVEVIHLRGHTLPIFRLSTVFGMNAESRADDEKAFVVIVSVGGQRTGFVVDELLGQEEVVIKPLADYVQEKSGFSGATIIGDGRISLILDVYELVRMTANKQAKKQQKQAAELKAKIRRRGSSKAHS